MTCRFGTELGQWTVAELRSLIANKDAEMAQMTSSYNAYAPAWGAKDSAGYADFTNDWHALQQRYASARGIAENTLSNLSGLVPESMNPANDEYMGIIDALTKSEGQIQKGDLQDLYNRLSASQAKPVEGPGFKLPDQTGGKDADLATIKAADNAAKGFQSILSEEKLPIALAVAGIGMSAVASVFPFVPLLGLAGILTAGAGTVLGIRKLGI